MSCNINSQNYQHPTLYSLFKKQKDCSVFVEWYPGCYKRNLFVLSLNWQFIMLLDRYKLNQKSFTSPHT